VSCDAITRCVARQRVFIVVSVYFVIDSFRKLLDTPLFLVFSKEVSSFRARPILARPGVEQAELGRRPACSIPLFGAVVYLLAAGRSIASDELVICSSSVDTWCLDKNRDAEHLPVLVRMKS
jgi:hypothetical protein